VTAKRPPVDENSEFLAAEPRHRQIQQHEARDIGRPAPDRA